MEASHAKTVEWEAADEIERLRAEVGRLNSELTDAYTDLNSGRQDNGSFTAEFKRLTAEVERLRAECQSLAAWVCVHPDGKTGIVCGEGGSQYCAKDAEMERLRADVQTWQSHAKTAIWSDSAECQMLAADNERLRAALEWINQQRYTRRDTINPANGYDRAVALNERLLALMDAARAALTQEKPNE